MKKNFYAEIAKLLVDYSERYKIKHVIIGSPSFWKEELKLELDKTELPQKVSVIFATCNSTGENAINEILKRPETKQLLSNERASTELNLVENLLGEISKDGPAVYGVKATENAAIMGAIGMLMVTDKKIQTAREDGSYDRIDRIMFSVEKAKGEITIISSDNDGGQRLDGLGGIAAILRFKLQY